jgi:hypothetical protein
MWWQPLQFELPNINTSIEKQQKFFCEFVDLKRNGWNHYSRALNELTYDFYRPVLARADKAVAELAENMKTVIRTKLI